MKKWIWIGLLYLAAISTASAQAPGMFRYQGRLVDGTNLVNATLSMSFKLYNAESDGALLYEDSSSVQIVDGLYSTMIGDDTIFGSLGNALTNATVYLELTIDSETLAPRERLVSVPYALNAGEDNAPVGSIVLSDTYPNPELEAQGYSIVETADWEQINDPYLPHFSTETDFLGHGNELWAYFGMQSEVFKTSDGKQWTKGDFPYSATGDFDAISHNGKAYFFKDEEELQAASTSNTETWTTWTNDFGSGVVLDDIDLFKNEFFGFVSTNTASGPVGLVFKSSNGRDWIQISSSNTFDLSSHGTDSAASENKMWIIAPHTNGVKKTWNSLDGITWEISTSPPPSDTMSEADYIFYDEHLWCFDPTKQTCWKSGNDGNSWSVVTTNLPIKESTMNFDIITHDEKLWMAGSPDDMDAMNTIDLSWSTNGIDWNLSLVAGGPAGGSLEIEATEDGRLWAYNRDGPTLYIIGGPKKQDGLYYYRKD